MSEIHQIKYQDLQHIIYIYIYIHLHANLVYSDYIFTRANLGYYYGRYSRYLSNLG